MLIFKEGDRSKAICQHCKKKVETTFKVRTSLIHDGTSSYKVPNALVGVCDICDSVISIPQQSFAAVAEVRKKADKENLEVRVPRHMLDILNNSIQSLGIEVSADLRAQLIRLYLADTKAKQYTHLKQNLTSALLKGTFKRSSRLSIKVTSQLENLYKTFLKNTDYTKADLIDSIIIEVKNDLLERKNPSRIAEVRNSLLAAG